MLKRALVVPLAAATILWGPSEKTAMSAGIALPLMDSLETSDVCLMPPTRDEAVNFSTAVAAYQGSQRAGAAQESLGSPPGWPGKGVLGGNIPAREAVMDPWPTFDGMAVDGESGI